MLVDWKPNHGVSEKVSCNHVSYVIMIDFSLTINLAFCHADCLFWLIRLVYLEIGTNKKKLVTLK